MAETKKIKNFYEIRDTDNKTFSEMRRICRSLNVFDNEKFTIWFINRFGYKTDSYFSEWANRYQKGTQAFIGHMDEQSLNIFKKVFL